MNPTLSYISVGLRCANPTYFFSRSQPLVGNAFFDALRRTIKVHNYDHAKYS